MAEQRYLQRVVGVTHMVQDRDGVFDLVEYVGVLERAFAAAAAVEVEPHACHAMRGEGIADVLIEFARFDTHVAQEPVHADHHAVVCGTLRILHIRRPVAAATRSPGRRRRSATNSAPRPAWITIRTTRTDRR